MCSYLEEEKKNMYPNTFKDMASKTLWPLFPRRVAFEWNDSPLHWMPQSPIGSHAVNHFSFTLVRGEYFFCRIFNKALPFVTDEKLKKDVETFIRQEAIHAQAHKESIEKYIQRYGVDIEKQYERVIELFDYMLADKPFGKALPKRMQKSWLLFRVGIVAAAEHYTCALGQYVLTKADWEEKGCDPAVSDLFTWHCAEEVEHRTVAFDLFEHLGGSYALRVAIMSMVAPIFTYLMAKGTQELAAVDRSLPKSQQSLTRFDFWRKWFKASSQELVPSPVWFMTTAKNFFKPSYHPYYEGSTELALEYINRSPAVKLYEEMQKGRVS